LTVGLACRHLAYELFRQTAQAHARMSIEVHPKEIQKLIRPWAAALVALGSVLTLFWAAFLSWFLLRLLHVV
jgi:hypothetical protein